MRLALLGLSLGLALAAVLFPTGWYEAMPRAADLPPRMIEGTTLLRLTFLIEALLVAGFAVTCWSPDPEPDVIGVRPASHDPDGDDLSRKQALVLLSIVFVVGVVLRVFRLELDLWLDEIATVSMYAARPMLEIYGSYLSPGNHLLNSLLIRASSLVFGVSEWSVRLPAVLLGAATIPVMYWAARLAMSRAASVGAALLLAVSYHHIFFSQNARGYSGYLLFVLLSSALLASVLRRGSFARWTGYVFATALGFAALMTTAFALVAQVMVGAAALWLRRRRGIPLRPLLERLAIAFGAVGLLAFQIYAVAIPDVVAIYPTVFNVQGSGYVFFSREFLAEIARGLSAGFALGIAALPLLAVAGGGFIILFRRSWVLAASLLLSVAVTVVFLLVRGQSIAPRLLLAGLPLAILSCMATVDAIARSRRRPGFLTRVPSRVLALGLSAILAVASALTLPAYYSAPKQPYRQAIRHLETTKTAQSDVIVIYPAVGGFRYYLRQEAVPDSLAYHFVNTMADYDFALQSGDAGRQLLATTLFRVLRSSTPLLAERVEREWVPVKTFRGTLGDGNVMVWRRRGK